MGESRWQFFIDVGGTFTDVVARRPDGTIVTHKLLSSGVVRGVVGEGSGLAEIRDPARVGEQDDFWTGYEFRLVDPVGDGCTGGPNRAARVAHFDGSEGILHIVPPLRSAPPAGTGYALSSREEAPILAIRRLMGLPLHGDIGAVDVRLGTTRATNALIERQGARVAFVTTRGFADVLKIGNQDRPELFKLHVRKREELAECCVEMDERIDARGAVIVSLDETQARRRLEQTRRAGIEAVAICLLHAHVNPDHEERLARLADSVGFSRVSVSSRLSRVEGIVARGDTTVADAYLSGVIRSCVASLERSLPAARLSLMTSNGGLINAANTTGKDTVLSGPAGGVVGCAYVTGRAGFDKAIGFDMGGTSTDVSRVEAPPAPFEYQHETVKAGVRIQTPMIAIETVAAGGGSLCLFDGQKLVVGPRSAGSDPGPACYGRGGPLTVTDVNLALGRVVADRFPFPLDRDVVRRHLAALTDEVNRATGASLTPIELAQGFWDVAVANMAAPIRRISIAKGYDASEYVLTTFGGAGGQHACAIARKLGIRRVLCNRLAGVLSALGIRVASPKRIVERSVDETLDDGALNRVREVLRELAEQAKAALLEDGVPEYDMQSPIETLDLCYAGQASLITVPAGDETSLQRELQARHTQLYGYDHRDRSVEIRRARVELAGKRGDFALPPNGPYAGAPSAGQTAVMVVSATVQDVPLLDRDALGVGARFKGPAIVIEQTSTIVVEPGWSAEVLATGDLLLNDQSVKEAKESFSEAVDPVRLELFSNQFASIAEQMGTTLRRTALSTNVKERLDFSCAIFAPDGDLVVNAPHIPVHLGAMSECVKGLMKDVPAFFPGDVYATNDPYRGGSHLNDVTIVTPVHNSRGDRVIFFVASRAHHAEIGGIKPGSMPPDSTCLTDEGVVIRAFRYVEQGGARVDALRELLTSGAHPSRAPRENLADVAAQVAANQTGVRELLAMVDRCGIEVVHAYMRHIRRAAEQKARRALAGLPDGTHRFEDRMDDGTTIRLSVSINQDRAVFDFSGTDPVVCGNLNANRAIVTSAVLYGLRCLIDEDIPLNSGVLAPVEINLPVCFLNPPLFDDPAKCPAVAGGNVETSQRVTDCVLGALGAVAASQGTMNNLLLGNDRFGYYETIGGGAGAGPGFDGADAVHTHMTNTRLTDPEVLESRYPVRLLRFAIRHGSGGAGRYRGGNGVVREIEFLEPLEVSIISQRRTLGPYGLHGGGSGKPGVNLLLRSDGTQERLASIASVRVTPGDRLRIESPGGGGWGMPGTKSEATP